MKNQSTHWYRVGNGSWTANPLFANQGEVERVGLHDCFAQDCEEAHCGSAEEYLSYQLYAAEVARISTGN